MWHTGSGSQVDIEYILEAIDLHSQNGGNVTHKGQGEYGFAKIHTVDESPLLKKIENESQVWMSHGDEIDSLGNGFEIIAKSSNDVIAAIHH